MTDRRRSPMKKKPWFLVLASLCALVAIAASLEELSYGGESTLVIVTWTSWAVAGSLAFVSGLRGEHRRWTSLPSSADF